MQRILVQPYPELPVPQRALPTTGTDRGDRPACAPPVRTAFPNRWRDLWPDYGEALRAGTWGDGGRDY